MTNDKRLMTKNKIVRKFSSYGYVNPKLHYYVPRQALVDEALLKLLGDNPEEGGHYITVWAPRQRGKTWVLFQAVFSLRDEPEYKDFDVAYVPLEDLKSIDDVNIIAQQIAEGIFRQLDVPPISIEQMKDLPKLFSKEVLNKPLILVLDEFDALQPKVISTIVSMFRNIHFNRTLQANKPSWERDFLLHGVALIGVRAVLGIENKTGSPFNVQQGMHIPNLTFEEVQEMYRWYEQDSGQQVEQAVIDRVFYETNGQPGLVSWLGELLTVKYNEHNPSITTHDFDVAYGAAVRSLPNANVINIISKAKQEPHKQLILELFQTQKKLNFMYEDPTTNFLYMNGVIDEEVISVDERYIKFPSPFIQKKLFNYFSKELFDYVGQLYNPLDVLDDVFTANGLHIPNLLKRYEAYLKKNSHWLFNEAPRRHDNRIYEAVYHFNFYMYLFNFIQDYDGKVWPEFPTGNGKIDVMIKFEGKLYGLELKSFANYSQYKKALQAAADYAQQLNLTEINLVLFIETIDDDNRNKLETVYIDPITNIKVIPTFVATDT